MNYINAAAAALFVCINVQASQEPKKTINRITLRRSGVSIRTALNELITKNDESPAQLKEDIKVLKALDKKMREDRKEERRKKNIFMMQVIQGYGQ